uniref:Uncharacterized protein n=1 Tax=Streptomyces globisporus TaxID=1908 RepID=Q8GMD0_STRGL|nr:hypothetical protein [Streptomyces globisporus]
MPLLRCDLSRGGEPCCGRHHRVSGTGKGRDGGGSVGPSAAVPLRSIGGVPAVAPVFPLSAFCAGGRSAARMTSSSTRLTAVSAGTLIAAGIFTFLYRDVRTGLTRAGRHLLASDRSVGRVRPVSPPAGAGSHTPPRADAVSDFRLLMAAGPVHSVQ